MGWIALAAFLAALLLAASIMAWIDGGTDYEFRNTSAKPHNRYPWPLSQVYVLGWRFTRWNKVRKEDPRYFDRQEYRNQKLKEKGLW